MGLWIVWVLSSTEQVKSHLPTSNKLLLSTRNKLNGWTTKTCHVSPCLVLMLDGNRNRNITFSISSFLTEIQSFGIEQTLMVGCCMFVMSTLLSCPAFCLSCWPKKKPPMFEADIEFLDWRWCDGGGGGGEVVGDGGGGGDMVQVQELSCTVGATLTGLSLTG